jgi:hypothetical protein
MRMTALATALASILVLTGGLNSSAQADPYAWCAEYGSRGDGGGTNCYFQTFRQCQEAISGNGGFCRRNTFYTGSSPRRGERAYSQDRRW